MKIVQIGHHCCVRLQKQAIALSQIHDVHLLAHRIPVNVDCYKTIAHWHNSTHLMNELKLHSDADIFHIHNEPNWMVFIVKEVFPNKKVVLDIHDAMKIRSDKWEDQKTEERAAFEMADALVHVNEPCMKLLGTDKPQIALPPYPNDRDMQYHSWYRTGGIVYEGLVQIDKSVKVMQYANYLNLAKGLYDAHIPFHIHSPKLNNKEIGDEYKDICFIEKCLPYRSLLKQLGVYDWGLVGNIDKYKEWRLAAPNKLFEYLAAGLPVIAMNADWCEDFVVKHGVGISVKSVKEIKNRWDERKECQRNVFIKRRQFTMEKNLEGLENLYKRILG